MRAALYCRVSTLEQATEGYSIGVQKEKLKHYANAQSYEIAGIYSDEGFSGKNLARPEMERLLCDVKSDKIDVVLIYKLDRLSRKVKDVLELVELFDKFSVSLYSLGENLDLSSPFGRAALKMSATFSELERETIVERMEMGKHARAKSGKYTCPGKPPFGYKLNRELDRLEIVQNEAEAIREMFVKYTEGCSFRKLYEYCKLRFPDIKYFSNPMCCKPIIERPLYAGYFNHCGELIKAVNCEPIISYETYLRAQEVVERNRTVREHDNTPYLLTGLITCGVCGRAFCGKRREHKSCGETKYTYTSYGCAARLKFNPAEHGNAPCRNEIYPADGLEKLIERAVCNLEFSEFASLIHGSALADELTAQNAELKKQKERMLDLYLSEQIDKDTYADKFEELDKKIRKNAAVIENERRFVSNAPQISISKLKALHAGFESAPKKQKRELLKLLIEKIIIDGESVTIKWNVK